MKRAIASISSILMVLFLSAAGIAQATDTEIIHDGEYYFLKAQHGEEWAAEDKEVDKMLSVIREKNGGKRPNILYILRFSIKLKLRNIQKLGTYPTLFPNR